MGMKWESYYRKETGERVQERNGRDIVGNKLERYIREETGEKRKEKKK